MISSYQWASVISCIILLSLTILSQPKFLICEEAEKAQILCVDPNSHNTTRPNIISKRGLLLTLPTASEVPKASACFLGVLWCSWLFQFFFPMVMSRHSGRPWTEGIHGFLLTDVIRLRYMCCPL